MATDHLLMATPYRACTRSRSCIDPCFSKRPVSLSWCQLLTT